jgi:vacuolar-type H+-ATPase subunit F/Vma7
VDTVGQDQRLKIFEKEERIREAVEVRMFELQKLLNEEILLIKRLKKGVKINQNVLNQVIGKLDNIKEANEMENMDNRNTLSNNIKSKFNATMQKISDETTIAKREREQLNINMYQIQTNVLENIKKVNESTEEKFGIIMQEESKKIFQAGIMGIEAVKNKMEEDKVQFKEMEQSLLNKMEGYKIIPVNDQMISRIERKIENALEKMVFKMIEAGNKWNALQVALERLNNNDFDLMNSLQNEFAIAKEDRTALN